MVWLKRSFLILLLLAVFVAGALFQRNVQVNRLLERHGLRHPYHVPSSTDLPIESSQAPVLADDNAAFTGLLLGQSNAGSHGLTFKDQTTPVNSYQFWQGNLYPASDPLFGSSGDGGSIWTQLSPRLLDDHQAVVWAATVVGATSVADWAPGGAYHQHLLDMLRAIQSAKVPVDAIFWMQGETDATRKTTEEEYFQRLRRVIEVLRSSLPDTAIYLAKSTRCYQYEPYEPVRKAIDQLVAEIDGVYPGIDLDTLGLGFRFDGCHLTQEGQTLAAQQWYELLQSGKE